MYHLRSIRHALGPILREERRGTLTSADWRADGSVVVTTQHGSSTVTPRCLDRLAHNSVVDLLQYFQETLFPAGFVRKHLAAISIADLKLEDSSSEHLFTLVKGSVIHSLQVELAHAAKAKALSETLAHQALDRGQTFLRKFCTALCRTSLLPPSPFQVVDFTYASTSVKPRNFILVNGTQGMFVKGRRGCSVKTDVAVWPIPSSLTWVLCIYLCLYRPVLEIASLEKLRRATTKSLADFQTFIFVRAAHLSQVNPNTWSVDSFHGAVADSLGMTWFVFRETAQVVNERRYASVLGVVTRPLALNRQGQHSARTADTHYAIQALQRSSGSQFSVVENQVLLARCLHANCRLAPPPFHPTEKLDSHLSNPSKPTLDDTLLDNYPSVLVRARLLLEEVRTIQSCSTSETVKRLQRDAALQLTEIMTLLSSGYPVGLSKMTVSDQANVAVAGAAMVSFSAMFCTERTHTLCRLSLFLLECPFPMMCPPYCAGAFTAGC